jgi:hypothetical protein
VALNDMKSSFLLAALLALAPACSIACTCGGTQSITFALMNADAVVVGRVKAHAEGSYKPARPNRMVVEVSKALKGSFTGDIEIAEDLMCYQSFSGDDFTVGKTFVFPLTQIDLANPDDTFGMLLGPTEPDATSYKMFSLPTCSHTALLLSEEKLYTNELTPAVGRQLDYYMHASVMNFLFSAGLFSIRGAIASLVVIFLLFMSAVFILRRRAKTNVV